MNNYVYVKFLETDYYNLTPVAKAGDIVKAAPIPKGYRIQVKDLPINEAAKKEICKSTSYVTISPADVYFEVVDNLEALVWLGKLNET